MGSGLFSTAPIGVGEELDRPLDYSKCTSARRRVWLPVPNRGCDNASPCVPRAGRGFASGECVEKAYALLLESHALQHSYLEPYLYALDEETDRKLFPWGWGLLYARSSSVRDANLVAEIVREAADDASADSHSTDSCKQRYWINFRTRRPVEAGESLTVLSQQTLPPAYGLTAHHFGDLSVGISQKRDIQDSDVSTADYIVSSDPPDTIELLEKTEDPVSVELSPVHGLGCFATRDIPQATVIELTPCLHLEVEQEIGILDDYAFEFNDHINTLVLGNGSIYNHSDKSNVSHYKYKGNPYLEVWIADRFIAKGEEICHDYGEEYFEARDMPQVIDEDEDEEDTLCC